jgi:hypothetical protein
MMQLVCSVGASCVRLETSIWYKVRLSRYCQSKRKKKYKEVESNHHHKKNTGLKKFILVQEAEQT